MGETAVWVVKVVVGYMDVGEGGEGESVGGEGVGGCTVGSFRVGLGLGMRLFLFWIGLLLVLV